MEVSCGVRADSSAPLWMKRSPFRDEEGKGWANQASTGKDMELFSNLVFILFQVLVTALHSFLSSCGEGSFYGEYVPTSIAMVGFFLNRRSHIISVKEARKATGLLMH